MFGVKIKKLVTEKAYTTEELFEQLKDKQFAAGVPSLTKHGLNLWITFPPLDRNNQVQIYPAQMGKGPYTKWMVTKGQEAGVGNLVKGELLGSFTRG